MRITLSDILCALAALLLVVAVGAVLWMTGELAWGWPSPQDAVAAGKKVADTVAHPTRHPTETVSGYKMRPEMAGKSFDEIDNSVPPYSSSWMAATWLRCTNCGHNFETGEEPFHKRDAWREAGGCYPDPQYTHEHKDCPNPEQDKEHTHSFVNTSEGSDECGADQVWVSTTLSISSGDDDIEIEGDTE